MFECEEKVVTSSRGEGYLRIQLSGDVHIENISVLQELLMRNLQEYQRVVLDVDQVSCADFTMLQLLCAANKYACNHGKVLELKDIAGGCVGEKMQMLGFVHNTGHCVDKTGVTRCIWMSE